jgi:outer membrane protein
MKAMTWNGSKWMQTCAGCLAALAIAMLTTSSASAQQISDARIRELIKQAGGQVAAGQQSSTPAAPQGTPGTTQPVVAVTLDEAVKLALDRNLDIAVQRLNPEQFDLSLAGLKAVYRPSLTSQLATQKAVNPTTSTLIGGSGAGSGVNQGVTTYNGGIAQNVPWGGGGFNVTLNNTRTTTSSLNTFYNPYYNPNWTAQYTQPLFRGFSIDSTRQQIVVTKLNQDISEIQLRATIINTLSNVRSAYWDYVFAIQSVDVAKQSVALAERLVKDNQTRVEVGTMAPIDVVQAQSQAATARQTLVQAEATSHTAELALKRLIVSGTQDPNWSARLDPVDRPDFVPEPIDLEGSVRRALSARTDIAQAKKNVDVDDVTLKFLRNQTLPQADLVARYGLVGVGGTQILTTAGTGANRIPTGQVIPGGYSDALSSLFGKNFPTWNVTLNFSYPIGTSSADASVARARVQLNQVQAQLKQLELQVATDVTNAAVTAQSNIDRVQAAQAARELAQKQLDAENSKFEVGMSTNYNVVLAQRDLATAQNNELQAVLAYRKSLVELDRLQQTTLQSSGITVLSTGGLNNTATGSGRPTVVAGGGS